jgi:zinc-ribbon domain
VGGVGPTGRSESGQREVSRARRSPPNLVKLHRKAKLALKQALAPGESPLLVLHGLGDSAIIGTDRAAYVFKSGVKAGIPFGHRLKPFEYESIMRVDVRRGRGVDVVVIHAPLKISVCPSYWADERDDPWKARNAIPVALLDQGLEEGAGCLVGLVAGFQEVHARAANRGAPLGDRVARPTPPVLEHLGELEQEQSIEPVVVPGPGAGECPRCGNTLRIGWEFCPRCGTPGADARAHGHGRRFLGQP